MLSGKRLIAKREMVQLQSKCRANEYQWCRLKAFYRKEITTIKLSPQVKLSTIGIQ